MAVFRVERTHNYTVMSNYHLRDKCLSLKAKGLLSQMLSLPEGGVITMSIRDDSKKIILHFLAQAIECGVLSELFPLQYDELATTIGLKDRNYCRVCCQYLEGRGCISIHPVKKNECTKVSLKAPAIDFLETT